MNSHSSKSNGATSFSRNVISSNRRFAEKPCRRMSIGRIVILPNSKIAETIYTRDSLQREARASECSLQRAREGTPPYPTCCYARHMMRSQRCHVNNCMHVLENVPY